MMRLRSVGLPKAKLKKRMWLAGKIILLVRRLRPSRLERRLEVAGLAPEQLGQLGRLHQLS